MKLVSCYVENFGAISRTEYKFNAGLTVFSGGNGSGKTTLAEFLRAMFYGLPSVRAGSDKFNARQRYFPFSGGKFGGNVTFEAEGKLWRIERFFDKKSESRDETALYCAGNSQSVPADLGKRFFGLNENSFARTAFFNAEATDGGFDADVGERLGGVVTGGVAKSTGGAVRVMTGATKATGGANADEALAALEKRRRIIKAARGAGGLLDRNKFEREKLVNEAARLKEIQNNIAAKYSERAAAEERIKTAETGGRSGGFGNGIGSGTGGGIDNGGAGGIDGDRGGGNGRLTPGYAANKRNFIALTVIALLLVAAGAVTCVFSIAAEHIKTEHIVIGLIIIAAGVICFCAGLAVCIGTAARNKKSRNPNDMSGATADLGALYRRLAEVDAAINADEAEIERLPDVLADIERTDGEIKRLSENYEILSATIYYLSEAKKRLGDKYSVPVKSAFSEYLGKFKIACGGRISVTDGLDIILESGGNLHGERHLSAGQRSACSLCLRLALIDNMYAGEKPFLVLDDPFVNLDEKNLERALDVVFEAALEIQIIYFTCRSAPRRTEMR